MKKIFSLLAAVLLSTILYATPGTIPTVANLSSAYDVQNNMVLALYFDEEVCNDVVFVGDYNNWSTTPSQCLTFAALPNYEGWYVAEIPWSLVTNEDGSTHAPYGKSVQLKNDGSFDWEYQTGDTGAWINLGGAGAQTVNLLAGYDGEADVCYPAPGVYIYEIAYWKKHQVPCIPVPSHNYTIHFYAPACESNPGYKPAIIGHFNNWSTGVAMTEATDANSKKYYTYTIHDEEGQPFKFKEATDTDWSNQFQYYDANTEEWKVCDNISLPAATKDTTLVIDYSNTEEYSYTVCEKEDPFDVTLYFKAPAYSPDTIGVCLDYGVRQQMTYDEESDTWSATVTLTKSWVALCTGVFFYDWNNPQNELRFCDNVDYYLQINFYSRYTIALEHFVNYDNNGNKYAYIDCSDNQRYQWSGHFRTYHEHLLYLCDMESKTATVIGHGNFYIGYDHNYEIEGLGDLVIPNTISIYSQNEEIEYTVNGIANEVFRENYTLTSVIIPNSVTSIGHYAFYLCRNLTSVTLPESLTHIGDYAFNSCESLSSIEFPSSLKHIGYRAFEGCESLSSIEFPSSLKHIGSYAFSYCDQLTEIILPENVEEIGYLCFSSCKNLKEVYIPATCALIGYDIHYYKDEYYSPITFCPAIEKITAPAFCFNMHEDAFPYSAKTIHEIHINAGTLDADCWEFIKRSRKTLRKLDLSALENTVMDDEALDECFKLTSLQLPSSCEHIGYKAMAECVMLKSINIPSSVVEIDDRAFEDCRSIESIVFGDAQAANAPSRFNAPATAANQLKRIGNWAFYNAHELKNLNIPEGVEEIGDAAFYGCVYLEEMTLPSSVQTIGDNTFALCSKLKKITCNAATPPTIRAKTFYDVKRQIPVYVPEEAVTAYKADAYWQEFDIQGQGKLPSSVEQVTNTQSKMADKVIKDGQLLILRGDKTYTVTGQEVK